MKRICLLIILLVPFISFSQKKIIEIDELMKIKKMSIINAQRYLMERGWEIYEIKEESSRPTIISTFVTNSIKTVKLSPSGNVNEIIFAKTRENNSVLLTFRDIKYSPPGEVCQIGKYPSHDNILILSTFTNYEYYLTKKNGFKLLFSPKYNVSNFEIIFERGGYVFWNTAFKTKNKETIYELIIMKKTTYNDAVKKYQEQRDIFKNMRGH